MKRPIPTLALAALSAWSFPGRDACAAGEALVVRVERFRLDPTAEEGDGYLAFANLHAPQPIDLSSVTLRAPDGTVLLDEGEASAQVGGLVPYAHERVLAFSGADLFLRLFGHVDQAPCPLPDGTYTAEQVDPPVSASATLEGEFPPFPDVSFPAPDQTVPESFGIQVTFPGGVAPEATRLLVVESRKGAFAFPPKFTYTVPGAATTIPVPGGVLEPRERVFLVVTSIVGSKGSATVIPVRVEATQGVIESNPIASLTVEKKKEGAGKNKVFVRKGTMPAHLLDGATAEEIEIRVGSLEPLVLPLALVKNGKLKVKQPDHPQIRLVKLDFAAGRYKVRGRLEDADRLGDDDDVVLTIR